MSEHVWIISSGAYDDYNVEYVLTPGTTQAEAEAIAAQQEGCYAERKALLAGPPQEVPYLGIYTTITTDGQHGEPVERVTQQLEYNDGECHTLIHRGRSSTGRPIVEASARGADFESVRRIHAEHVAAISYELANTPPPRPRPNFEETWYDAEGNKLVL